MWYSINRGWNFDRSLKFALLDRVCSRDFQEHIWSMPLVSGSNIVIGGGGASSSGNLYVLDTSCNIVKTISFSGHLKEGYLADVDDNGNLDWVGGLTQPNGENFAVVVMDIFVDPSPTTSTLPLGTLSDIAGKNNVRSIIPARLGGTAYGVFIETSQYQADNYRQSFLSVVKLSNLYLVGRINLEGWNFSSAVAGDFDSASGTEEIIVGLWSGGEKNPIYIIDLEKVSLREEIKTALKTGETVGSHALSVYNIDSQDYLELLVGGNKGCFYVFEIMDKRSRQSVYSNHYRRDQNLNAVFPP